MKPPRRSALLLVEDNPDDQLLLRRALSRAGIPLEVDLVQDGVEALEYLFAIGVYEHRDPAELPVAVLLDLNLPKLSGQDVLRRIRAAGTTRELPVLVLTSSAEQEEEARSWRLGASTFVRKPESFDELVESFRQLRKAGLQGLLGGTAPPSRRKPA